MAGEALSRSCVAFQTPEVQVGEEIDLPTYSMQEVEQHNRRDKVWIVISDGVFDFTDFVGIHPGGQAALLRHAGTDASEVFLELHSQSIFSTFAMPRLIGFLEASMPKSQRFSLGLDVSRLWQGHPPYEEIDGSRVTLISPFPHEIFEGKGLETYRFNWAIADRLSYVDKAEDAVDATRTATTDRKVRQKSMLQVLNTSRDWLHISADETYSFEMRMKRKLLLEHPERVYVHDSASLPAQQELLEIVVDWLLQRYPRRFELRDGGSAIAALSKGYSQIFRLIDWSEEPLKLVGLLIQEDVYLLEEQELCDEDIKDDHPSGKKHVFVAGYSCFSFQAPFRRQKSMARIHHPNVPLWQAHLQHNINRFLANMVPELSWYRHNWGFHFTTEWTGPKKHRHPDAQFVVDELNSACSTIEIEDLDVLPSQDSDDFIRSHLSHHVEYQTLRRLPKYRTFIVFTVRMYSEPMSFVEHFPQAAAALAAAVRRKTKPALDYLLLELRGASSTGSALLGYLTRVSERGLVTSRTMKQDASLK